MIVCPNCNHQNPDGATQCEACYTPLPATTNCPDCGATVQADAAFCGQCGFDLRPNGNVEESRQDLPDVAILPTVVSGPVEPDVEIPATVVEATVVSSPLNPSLDLEPMEPLVEPEPIVTGASEIDLEKSNPVGISSEISLSSPSPQLTETSEAESESSLPASSLPATTTPAYTGKTQLQQQSAKLLHVRTNTTIELPTNLPVVHVGKPNDRVPPDIDVSGLPDSEVVSRIHADIRVEGDIFYIEDTGSSNGTYINNNPMPKGNRHKLRPGDRISLGKGDLVSFLFQIS